MLEQSSIGRTYTRDAYAPLGRVAHAELEKLTASSIRVPFHFLSNFEESVLDSSESVEITFLLTMLSEGAR
jgi:hypothetical protein